MPLSGLAHEFLKRSSSLKPYVWQEPSLRGLVSKAGERIDRTETHTAKVRAIYAGCWSFMNKIEYILLQ